MDATKELKPERKPHKCWVQASSEEEALTVAADLMVREVVELKVLSSRGTSYSVGCLVSDVELIFAVSEDMMKITMKAIENVQGARDLSVGAVRRQLQISGVDIGADEEGIVTVVGHWLSHGKVDTTTALAVGSAPIRASNSSIKFSGSVRDKAVFSGDVIGVMAGPVEAKAGVTVFGTEIEPEEGEEQELVLGFGLEARGGEVLAMVYGEVKLEGVHLSVIPGFVLCERELQVTLDLFPFSLTGRAVTISELKSVLSDSGVQSQYVDLDHMREILKGVWESGEPYRGVIVARGVEPVRGSNGRVELTVNQTEPHPLPASPKTVVAVWHPRVEPLPGTNLFGVKIEPEALETTTNDEARCGEGVILVGNEFVTSGFGIVRVFGSYVDLTSIVTIADDGLTALMDIYPFDCMGVELNEDSYLLGLLSSGVEERFAQEDAIKSAVVRAKKTGAPVFGVTVAFGEPPEEAWATEYLFREGLSGRSVLKGEHLVEILEGAPSKPGTTVTGEKIDIAETRAGEGNLDLSGACLVSKDGGYVVSTEYGQVHFSPTSVSVEPGLRILKDGEGAVLDVYSDHLGGALSLQDFLDMLLERGVVRNRIDEPAIMAALAKIESGEGAQKDVLVASSLKPKAGSPPSIHIQDPSVMVFPNERVAWVTKSADSVNGEDIFGQRLIADAVTMNDELLEGPFVRSVDVDPEKEPNVLWAFESTALGRMSIEEIVQETNKKSVLSVTPSLRFSGNKTSCWMELSSTHLDGSPVRVQEVASVLLGMGFDKRVICGSSIQRVIDSGGGEALVAKSEEWKAPSDWRIKTAFTSPNEAIFSGEQIATVEAGTAAVEGFDLEGKPLAVGAYGAGMSLCAGPYASMNEDGVSVFATTYGHAVLDGLLVKMLPGIWVSPDKMEMYVNVFPKRVGGESVTIEDFKTLFAEAGFSESQVDEEALGAAVESAQKRGRPEWGVCVGKGQPPQIGINGSLEAIGEHSFVAFPGDAVVKVVPEQEGASGVDVFGVELPVPFIAAPIMVSPEGGCRIGSAGLVEADVYGRVYVEGARVVVQPAIHFSPDRLNVSLDIYKQRINGEKVTQEELIKVLEEANIVERFIDREALKTALSSSAQYLLDVVVAVGEAPILGTDGAIRLEGDTSLLALSGDLVASFDPHTPPVLGVAVDGGAISPSEEPERVHLAPGDGVTLSQDQLQATADVAGFVEVSGDSASVNSAVTFSDDNMECRMTLTSKRYGGGKISVDDIVEELTQQGVLESCVDREAIGLALESGHGVSKAVVARGKISSAGTDGGYFVVEDLENGALFQGDEVVRLKPAIVSAAGHDVFGKQIDILAGVNQYVIEGQGGIEVVDEGLSAIAPRYGGASIAVCEPIESNTEGVAFDIKIIVRFNSGIALSPNLLDCHMDLYPHRAGGGESGLAEMVSVLKEQEVLERFVLKRVLTGAIRMSARMLQPQYGILVARGEPPRHGVDGRIKLLDSKHPKAGNRRAFGRVDLKEMDTFVQVVEGDAVAKLAAPLMGVPGETVTGDKLEAHDGAEVALELGDGVELRDEVIYAVRQGVVSALGAKIDVVDLVTVDGDVDYHSGNVRVRSGCVRIKGSIFPGFRVSSPENIEVDGSVDGGAKIEAGGHIVVRGAVVAGQKESTVLKAGGDITIGVGRNATLTADGDVIIQKEALHCIITTESRVIVERRPGVLSGGEIRAKGGVFTHQLGSAQWTPTTLHIGGESKLISKLMDDLSRVLQRRMALNDKLDGLTDVELREQAHAEELPDVEKLIASRNKVRRECFQLEESLKAERFKVESEADPMIEVRENIFPRVVVNFGRSQYKCEGQVTRKRVFLDVHSNEVQVDDLSADLPEFLKGPETVDPDE